MVLGVLLIFGGNVENKMIIINTKRAISYRKQNLTFERG